MDRFSMTRMWTAVDFKLAFVVALVMLGRVDVAAAANACNRQAVSLLKQNSPTGYDVYQTIQDKAVFNSFSADCSDKQQFLDSEINTAVHETVHMIRGEKEAYHLVNNELLPVPPAPGYFPPSVLVPILGQNPKVRNDDYFNTYLNGKGETAASSRKDFTYLLDEMNAYTNDLQTQIELSRVHPLTHREGGVPALMTFVSAYASYARDHSPKVWMDMSASPASPTRKAITKLWSQAETVLRQACQLAPTSPIDQSAYLNHLCGASQTGAISIVLGRQAQCPVECTGGRRQKTPVGPVAQVGATEERIELEVPTARRKRNQERIEIEVDASEDTGAHR